MHRAATLLACSAAAAAAAAAATVSPAGAADAATLGLEGWIASQIISNSSSAAPATEQRTRRRPGTSTGTGTDTTTTSSSSSGSSSSGSSGSASSSSSSSGSASSVPAATSTAVSMQSIVQVAQQQQRQQQQQVSYPYMSAAGQLHVDPSTIPARPWAAGIGIAADQQAAAAAAAAVGSQQQQAAAGDWQVTALVQCMSGIMTASSSSSSSSSVRPAGAAPAASAPTPPAAAAAAASWDEAFVQQVLSAVQRAQWLAEEISRVQYNSTQAVTGSTASRSSSSSSSVVDGSGTALEQQQQQAAEATAAEVLPVLYRQLQRQLTAHLSREVTCWQDIARVYEVFGEHLNPGIVCWCLTALQKVYRRGLVPPGQHKQAAMRLLQQLLRLVWHWQQRLTPRVRVCGGGLGAGQAAGEAPALREPMRDALAHQYQAALAAAAAQQQEPRGQQQGGQPLLPWAEHAALLLGLARLGLPAHTHLARGTSAAVCKVVSQQIALELKQQQQGPQQGAPPQPAAAAAAAAAAGHSSASSSIAGGKWSSSNGVAALQQQQQQQQQLSHLCLLLYALSELGLNPTGRLLRHVCQLSLPLLHGMHPPDLAMMAVALGRCAYLPPAAWGQSFLDATAAAATATAAAAAAAAAAAHEAHAPAAAGEAGSSAGLRGYTVASAAAAAALDAVLASPARDSSSSSRSRSGSSQQLLNPTDITSLLTAVHSMNLKPPEPWLSSMMQAGLAQLPAFDLQQCVILLLAMHKLRMQPQAAWLLAVADRVRVLAGGGSSSSSSGSGSSWGSLSSGSSLDAAAAAAVVAATSPAAVADTTVGSISASSRSSSRSSSSSSSDTDSGALSSLDEQRRRQQQWQQQMAHQAQPPPPAAAAAAAPAPSCQHPHAAKFYSKLCLYLWALSKVACLLPEADAVLLRQQLTPAVTAAAKQLAGALPLLRPLDLVQLMLGLWQLQCRPGPGFMAAHMARCEAAHAGFSGSMYQELCRAYQGLGFQPSQSLMVMMYSKMGSQQQQQQ
ncbi:hypothetical protein COO60DRAFT_1644397 [Scenedesmus sp. NREL 46B-D3]|nr:hypothetical protein COO60DRAFT_1644397 [Scenedesmus sp. NREL 46B-D3]